MTQLNIYVDGGSRGNPGKAASAFVVIKSGKVVNKEGHLIGIGTNNEAEYMSVVYALRWLVKEKIKHQNINIFLDSELVTKQLNGLYKLKSNKLMPLMRKVRSLEEMIPVAIKYNRVPREKNKLADSVVNEVLDGVENN